MAAESKAKIGACRKDTKRLGMLFNLLPRMATWAQTGQITLYTPLIWLPAVVAAPRTRLKWISFLISWAIGAAVWAVAQNIATKELATPEW